MTHRDLLGLFENYFEVVCGERYEVFAEALQLRYEVYCKEARVPGFDPARYPNGHETDAYDARSAHSLLRHRPSGAVAGTVRLVLADPANPASRFPVEVAARDRIINALAVPSAGDRGQIGEVSRLMLTARFRARQGEAQWPDGLAAVVDLDARRNERRSGPHPFLGLMKALLQMSWERGIRYWYAGMEPRLDRRLRQFGACMKPVSPIIEYHGSCRVYWAYLPELLQGMHYQQPEVWGLLTGNGRIWPLPDDGNVPRYARRVS